MKCFAFFFVSLCIFFQMQIKVPQSCECNVFMQYIEQSSRKCLQCSHTLISSHSVLLIIRSSPRNFPQFYNKQQSLNFHGFLVNIQDEMNIVRSSYLS